MNNGRKEYLLVVGSLRLCVFCGLSSFVCFLLSVWLVSDKWAYTGWLFLIPGILSAITSIISSVDVVKSYELLKLKNEIQRHLEVINAYKDLVSSSDYKELERRYNKIVD